MNKRQVGSRYEEAAARFLEGKGYRILDKNYRCRCGEIDLVAMDGEYLVFVEVKYRRDAEKGDPLEAVSFPKQRRISRTAACYLLTHPKLSSLSCRFDVVGIEGESVTLIQDAFFYTG